MSGSSSNNTYTSFNSVKQNDEWDISLSENPTTGYSWMLYVSGSGSIATVYDDYKSPFYDENNPLLGAGGTHTWHFKAGSKGEVTLTFVYQRPWESENPIETRIYRYKIV